MGALFSYFILVAVVACIGLHAISELKDASGIVPRQVMRPRAAHLFWGRLLTGFGGFALGIGLMGISQPDVERVLPVVRVLALLVLAAYGLWIVVGSGKVVYQDEPSADHHAHH